MSASIDIILQRGNSRKNKKREELFKIGGFGTHPLGSPSQTELSLILVIYLFERGSP
jgi:hypothetical protein